MLPMDYDSFDSHDDTSFDDLGVAVVPGSTPGVCPFKAEGEADMLYRALPDGPQSLAHSFGGLLDSPIVVVSAPAPSPSLTETATTLLSPPLTIATQTVLLPDAAPCDHGLLSPMSPDGSPALFADSEGLPGLVPLAQPAANDNAAEDDSGVADTAFYAQTCTRSLSPHPTSGMLDAMDEMPSPTHTLSTVSSLSSGPPSPTDAFFPSSPCSVVLGLDRHDYDEFRSPWSCSPKLLSLPMLSPSPDSELDDLELEMDADFGFGSACSPSPSRRAVTTLPSFADEVSPDSDWNMDMDAPPLCLFPFIPPDSDPGAAPTSPRSNNLLGLDNLPSDLISAKPAPSSILDAYSASELVSLAAAHDLPVIELDKLLDVRERARRTLAEYECASSSSSAAAAFLGNGDAASGSGTGLLIDHELRKSVPRDAGEPRRKRKRAKELVREVDALVGLKLGVIPATTALSPHCAIPCPPERMQRDKAGFAGLESVSELVARMVLRRREKCVRGLEGGSGRRKRNESRLSWGWGWGGLESGDGTDGEVL